MEMMKNFKTIKTCFDVISSIDDIVKLMRSANHSGLSTARFGIDDISMIDIIKLFGMLRAMHGEDVRLFEPGSLFNNDYFEIEIKVAAGYYINIRSEKVNKYNPKTNLINYN